MPNPNTNVNISRPIDIWLSVGICDPKHALQSNHNNYISNYELQIGLLLWRHGWFTSLSWQKIHSLEDFTKEKQIRSDISSKYIISACTLLNNSILLTNFGNNALSILWPLQMRILNKTQLLSLMEISKKKEDQTQPIFNLFQQ